MSVNQSPVVVDQLLERDVVKTIDLISRVIRVTVPVDSRCFSAKMELSRFLKLLIVEL